jgi:hypothetical protein
MAVGLSIACQVFAAWWIVTELSGNTARIAKPYNDAWYALAVNAPAAAFWFWYFARPHVDKSPIQGDAVAERST